MLNRIKLSIKRITKLPIARRGLIRTLFAGTGERFFQISRIAGFKLRGRRRMKLEPSLPQAGVVVAFIMVTGVISMSGGILVSGNDDVRSSINYQTSSPYFTEITSTDTPGEIIYLNTLETTPLGVINYYESTVVPEPTPTPPSYDELLENIDIVNVPEIIEEPVVVQCENGNWWELQDYTEHEYYPLGIIATEVEEPEEVMFWQLSEEVRRTYPIYEVYKHGRPVNVPVEWQWFIRDLTTEYDFPEEVVYGMIIHESTFNTDSLGAGKYHGLAQMSNYWKNASSLAAYRITEVNGEPVTPHQNRDLFNPYDNLVTLIELWRYYRYTNDFDPWDQQGMYDILYAHNTGRATTNSPVDRGYNRHIYSFIDELVKIDYSETVISLSSPEDLAPEEEDDTSVLGTREIVYANPKFNSDGNLYVPEELRAEYIWFWCLARMENEYAVAGTMGNIQSEAPGLNPTCRGDGGWSWGLCQWNGFRRTRMVKIAGDNWDSNIPGQLEYMWWEMETGRGFTHGTNDFDNLLAADSIRRASNIVLFWFERPANQGEGVQGRRASNGQVFYDLFAGKDPSPEVEWLLSYDYLEAMEMDPEEAIFG